MATAQPRQTTPRRPRPARGNGSSGGGNGPAGASARAARTNARFLYDVTGITLVSVGLVLLATLLFPASHAGENVFGTAVVSGMRLVVGEGAWAFPVVLIAAGIMLAVGKNRSWDNTLGATLLFLVFVAWWHLGHVPIAGQFARDNLLTYGGYVGAALSWCLRVAVGTVGGHIALAAFTVTALIYLFDVPLPLILGPVERLLHAGAKAGGRAAAHAAREATSRAAQLAEERKAANAERRSRAIPDAPRRHRSGGTNDQQLATSGLSVFRRKTPEPAVSDAEDTEEDAIPPVRRVDALAARDAASGVIPLSVREGKRAKAAPEPEGSEPLMAVPSGTVSHRGVDPNAPPLTKTSGFVLPPLALLRAPDPKAPKEAGVSEERRNILIQTLEDFGIGADITDVAHGPTLTRYEIALERGIKVSKIVSLADNLAMALAAIDVRVEAPIPGKSAIGIEVPSDNPTVVTLRECIERPEFKNAPGKLTFALGKDVTGTCRYADLAKMPHLLIGGSTGSGKSVGINTLISSLLYRCTPRELKLLMIDPKKVELSLYDGIPHLAAPVITNVKQAPSLFKQSLKEMEERYDKFARVGTRNIEGYNSRVSEEEKMPYWVIIVDELADLMMQSGPEIETAICRLAQLARATGIHLVLATQRPSVNVITGLIKANISSRIAFAVNSAVDSRTILDMVGADRLIGRGDMLFMPMDAPKPMRIQGCFVSEQETEELVTYLKAQAQPNYEVLPSTLSLATGEDDSGESEPEDDLFESAVRLVVSGGQASTSMLQRRFKVGYTRAARLVDMMEQKGIVGALDGAKPREILMNRDQVDGLFGGSTTGNIPPIGSHDE